MSAPAIPLRRLAYCRLCSRACSTGSTRNRVPGVPHMQGRGLCEACARAVQRKCAAGPIEAIAPRNPALSGPTAVPAGATDWTERGACRGTNNPAFDLPESRRGAGRRIPDRTVLAARRYCARCPVIDECAEFAARYRQVGLWGGEWRKASGQVTPITTGKPFEPPTPKRKRTR